MAEASKKPVKSRKPLIPDEKATMLAKTEKPIPMEVKAPAQMQTVPKPEEKAVQATPAKTEASVVEVKAVKETIKVPAPKPEDQPAKTPETPKAETKAEAPVVEVKAVKETIKAPAPKPEDQPAKTPETPKAEAKAEAKTEVKKEADPAREFVDGIMAEMALKGASKKRLIKTLAEQYGMDKQKVMFRLKRALITERYAAAHAEAGH